MLGVLGAGFLTQTLTFPITLIVLFAIYYPAIIQREERDLEKLFGKEYHRYKESVPTFFPKTISLSRTQKSILVKPKVFKKSSV